MEKDDSKGQNSATNESEETKKPSFSRRSFSLLAASVPAVFALSCKPRSAGTAALADAERTARADDASKFNQVTSAAFGEEGGKNPQASTRALGEEGGATTRALGEEGGKNNPVTTQAVGEEGDAGPGDEKWGPIYTTRALNEEGQSDEDYDKIPTITTRALGEEGDNDEPPKHVVTSMALGEEGGKGGAYDEIRRNDQDTHRRYRSNRRRGANLTESEDEHSNLMMTEATWETGEGDKNNVVTTQAVGEEGSADDSDVVLTSMALGEEASGNGKDDLYLTTRALHEEGDGPSDTGRIKDVNATTLAVGEEGGDFWQPDFDYGRNTLPAQQRAITIIQEICNGLGQPVWIKSWQVQTVETAKTNKQVLNVSLDYVTRKGDKRQATESSGTVTVKWVQGWTERMFASFAEIQLRRKITGQG